MSSKLFAGTGEPVFQTEIDGGASKGPRRMTGEDFARLLESTDMEAMVIKEQPDGQKPSGFDI